jgi:hypothetical protein
MASLTLFSIPKPFEGHIGVIQHNALASWRRLKPQPEIILFGNDAGVAEAAARHGALHVAEIAANDFGTPLVSDAFVQAQRRASHGVVMYTNADMLYDDGLPAAVDALGGTREFLLSGQRWDVDITLDLTQQSDAEWSATFGEAPRRGTLHGPSGMDYFVFPRQMDLQMPAMAVGRPGWDTWLVWSCRNRGIPVVNATASVRALHQNHSYASLRLGYQHWSGPERDLNYRAAGGMLNMLTLREASHELVAGQLVQPRGRRFFTGLLGTSRTYRFALLAKRWALYQLHR